MEGDPVGLECTEQLSGRRWRLGSGGPAQATCGAIITTIFLAIACVSSGYEARAQSLSWTWIGGSATVPSFGRGNAGVCGTPGVAAADNLPGARSHASSWVDNKGHLWLFGGYGYDCAGNAGSLSDLWEFDLDSQQWTWTGGSGAVGSNGGAAGVYGTLGAAAVTNAPGGRDSASSWTDGEGHLWLFGGYGFDGDGWFGSLNDLWEFDPSSQQWTWVAGSQTLGGLDGQLGIYGSAGVASAAAAPGGRGSACAWTDPNGDLWLFGGEGLDANGAIGELNDLWKFERADREWIWVSGGSTLPSGAAGRPGSYGARAVAAAGNFPGGRDRASAWADSDGNLWLFGGYGYDASDTVGLLNDLWEFDTSSAEWAWMGGSRTIGARGGVAGVYGSPAIAAAENGPGSREGASAWMDAGGNLWLFGGDGLDSQGNSTVLNDLWEFSPNSSEWVWMGGDSAGPTNSGPAGQYGTAGISTAGDAPGGRTGSTSWIDQQGHWWLFGGYGMDAVQRDGDLDDLWEFAGSANGGRSSGAPGYSLIATSVAAVSGAASSSTVTVTASGGYSGMVTLSCAITSTPVGAVEIPTCAAKQEVTLSPAVAVATTSITVNTTTAQSNAVTRIGRDAESKRLEAGAAFAMLLCIGLSRRRISALQLVMLAAVLCGLTGCGNMAVLNTSGGRPAGGTSPGIYICTVTGVGSDAAATRATTTFSVTVQ